MNGLKLTQGRLHIKKKKIKKNYTLGKKKNRGKRCKHLNRIASEVVQAPSLEVSKTHVDMEDTD